MRNRPRGSLTSGQARGESNCRAARPWSELSYVRGVIARPSCKGRPASIDATQGVRNEGAGPPIAAPDRPAQDAT
jgi:hypothetical protein